METCFNYTQRDYGYFSSDERKFISKIRKLKEKYPEDIRIIAEPEQNDGCIYCQLPSSWLKISPKRALTEEHRQKLIAASESFRYVSSDHGSNKGK